MSAKQAVASNSDARASTAPKEKCRVDLWAALAEPSLAGLHGSELLDDDDRQWCARLRQPGAQQQCLAAHILLRLALSDAVRESVLPGDWRFERDHEGRLSLAPRFPKLYFNLSHEHRIVVAAVCATNPVGIDVVRLAEPPHEPPLWSAVTPAERTQLLSESLDSRAHDFARLWALKEAYTKLLGVGHGLNFSLLEGDLVQRRLRQAERDCTVAFETHTLWSANDYYFVALAVGTERVTRIDSRGHLLDLTGGSWFRNSDISPHEAVWPKRWEWHWL
jgi:phosphopantetheinyl transferase